MRDDGSQDGTFEKLEALAQGDSRFKLLSRKELEKPLGVKNNFDELMHHSHASRVFFSDQDDIWKPDKIKIMLERFDELEKEGGEVPLLLHHDLEVVDVNKRLIAPSFWRMRRLEPLKATGFNRILVQNPVTGCAMLANRALIEKGKIIPAAALMHDGWLALVAAAFGRVEALAEPLVLYRQHSHNVIGARRSSLLNYLTHKFSKRPNLHFAQAQSFLKQFEGELTVEAAEILSAYLSLPGQSYWESRKTILKHQLYKQGILRNLAHLLSSHSGSPVF